MAEEGGGEELLELESSKSENVEVVKEGVASIALLPSGSISGHFIQLPHSICYGLHGSELACERECSRGEDYRLIKLTIVDFNAMMLLDSITLIKLMAGKDTVGMVEEKHGKKKIHVSFECETLKADKAAEDHIKKFMPKLAGLDAVGTFFLFDLIVHWILFLIVIAQAITSTPMRITRNMQHIQKIHPDILNLRAM
uniref:Uncharacterized protein n=1 Tax=Salix viminalis TaxID=40686 RepID=A0A6N2MXH1_SALVM